MNTMPAEIADAYATRIRERNWGWRNAFHAWYLVHGGTPDIHRENGRRVVTRDATEFIKTNPDALRDLGVGDVVQTDGTLHLDTDGEFRYEPIGDLGDGFTAYQRITG